ncbi:hypothetical protein ACFP81_02845 [Deinococcus lacus]|uniref:MT0933-like antitoxin protein n=1 Tax=Deinococcus lacus TaxID=392561 RepID=A0ABW1YC62_9DEIO
MTEKNALENLADAAKAKLQEGADRARAAGHDVAGEVGDSPLENLKDKLEGGVDKVKAGLHGAQAESSFDKAKEQISDTLRDTFGK